MKPTERLHQLGQSLWLDNFTRLMLRQDVLKGYIDELSVSGLTSNPSIFEKAISSGDSYNDQIAEVRGADLLRARARRPARRRRPLRRRPRPHRRR
jgi:transaldolase